MTVGTEAELKDIHFALELLLVILYGILMLQGLEQAFMQKCRNKPSTLRRHHTALPSKTNTKLSVSNCLELYHCSGEHITAYSHLLLLMQPYLFKQTCDGIYVIVCLSHLAHSFST